jgi:UDP-2,4-diacetamido-2,4,6-trideoxy-beta-L-altropyranose hydrolase
LQALAQARYDGAVDVVIGRAAPHLGTIRHALPRQARLHVDAKDVPALMSGADLAFGAGGTTSWERCCLGLPALVVEIADNQRGVIATLARAGAAVSLGSLVGMDRDGAAATLRTLLADGPRRRAMAAAAASLVDGRGAERILMAAIGAVPTKAGAVTLRLAEADDEDWLFDLQRKPQTRRFANTPRSPEPEEHRQWLQATLADPLHLLAIVEADGKHAGMLRLDRTAEAGRVNIATDPDYHRRGVGAAALTLAARLSPGRPLEAQILAGNAASLALFQSLGYREAGKDLYRREPL